MTAWANDSVFEFEVVSADSEKIVFLSKSDGVLIKGKGVHVRGIHKDIPFLFEKDRQLIELANQYKLDFVGLSFVRSAENVREAKALIGEGTQVLKNMETKPIPTIGEIEALYEIMKSGVYGVQMSEETAVGRYVPECVRLLEQMDTEIMEERIAL